MIYISSHLVQIKFSHSGKKTSQSHPFALLSNKIPAADPITSTRLSNSEDVLTPAELTLNR